MIAEINELPKNLKLRNDKNSITIAQSETVGNEHRIKIKDGVEFFEDAKGVLYMKNTVNRSILFAYAAPRYNYTSRRFLAD